MVRAREQVRLPTGPQGWAPGLPGVGPLLCVTWLLDLTMKHWVYQPSTETPLKMSH